MSKIEQVEVQSSSSCQIGGLPEMVWKPTPKLHVMKSDEIDQDNSVETLLQKIAREHMLELGVSSVF